jgi:hypothetical protein
VFQSTFEQLRESSNMMSKRASQSPRYITGASTRSSGKKQVFLSSKVKKKPVKKVKASIHQAALTDTESNKMHDLLKKGYPIAKTKKTYLTSQQKTISNKTKLRQTHPKLSNSRSPNRDDSRSTASNRKMKSTIASTEQWKKRTMRASGESVSIASEKPKAAYFKNTLESHNKIGPSTLNACKI